MPNMRISVADMRDVLREVQCALPIMFVSEACPDAPGVKGTCTALRFRDEYAFVTAAHVVDRNDQTLGLRFSAGSSTSWNTLPATTSVASIVTRPVA